MKASADIQFFALFFIKQCRDCVLFYTYCNTIIPS